MISREGSQCGQWAAPRSRSCELKVGGILRNKVGRQSVRLNRTCRRRWSCAGNAVGSWHACLSLVWLEHTRHTALRDCGRRAGRMRTIICDCLQCIACGWLREWRQQIQCKLWHRRLAGTGLLSSCLDILALGLLLIVRLFCRFRGGTCGGYDGGLWRRCCRLIQWRRQ